MTQMDTYYYVQYINLSIFVKIGRKSNIYPTYTLYSMTIIAGEVLFIKFSLKDSHSPIF